MHEVLRTIFMRRLKLLNREFSYSLVNGRVEHIHRLSKTLESLFLAINTRLLT